MPTPTGYAVHSTCAFTFLRDPVKSRGSDEEPDRQQQEQQREDTHLVAGERQVVEFPERRPDTGSRGKFVRQVLGSAVLTLPARAIAVLYLIHWKLPKMLNDRRQIFPRNAETQYLSQLSEEGAQLTGQTRQIERPAVSPLA